MHILCIFCAYALVYYALCIHGNVTGAVADVTAVTFTATVVLSTSDYWFISLIRNTMYMLCVHLKAICSIYNTLKIGFGFIIIYNVYNVLAYLW